MIRQVTRRLNLKGSIRHSSSLFRSKYGCYINGKEVMPTSADYFKVYAPATGEELCDVVSTDGGTLNEAITIADDVFHSGIWSRSDVRFRANVLSSISNSLREAIPELVDIEVAQTGRAVREMKAQLARLPEWFDYYAAVIRTHEGTCPPFLGNYINYVQRVPLGVCGLITPWNHPMLIAVKKIAPALATGNSVVVKPSELAPVSVLELGKVCSLGGLPDGVLNIVPGMGKDVGQQLCTHEAMRKIDLTGGTPTGRAVGAAAGGNLCSVVSELGGKAPMIIFDDCDIEQAVNGAAFATFVASGQTCIMGARVLVHEHIYDKFVTALAEKARRIRLGDPTDLTTQMGPVISESSRLRITGMVNQAVAQGATVLAGAKAPSPESLPDRCKSGYYYEPTVLAVTPQMDIWRDEVFGPVLVAVPFKTEQDAVVLANDSPFGLAAAVWTKDVMRAHRVADQLNVGIVWLNDHHRNDPSSPWGGMKDSGLGRENGLDAFHEYTQSKSVIVRMDDTPFDWFEQPDARYS